MSYKQLSCFEVLPALTDMNCLGRCALREHGDFAISSLNGLFFMGSSFPGLAWETNPTSLLFWLRELCHKQLTFFVFGGGVFLGQRALLDSISKQAPSHGAERLYMPWRGTLRT